MPLTYRPPVTARVKRELPPALPLPSALQTLGCRWWPLSYVEWCHARYGERFTVYPVDMPPLVFLSNPQDIRAVVSAPADVLHAGAGSAIIAPLIGEQAFILCEEEEHLCARTATLPAFHHKVVQRHAHTVAEIAAREIASWPLDTPFPTHTYIRRLTLQAVLHALFTGEEQHVMAALRDRVLDMLCITESFLLQEPRLRHLPGWRSTWRRFVKQRTHVETLILGLIARRREENGVRGDLLEMLLAAHNPDDSPMSDRQIHDHLMSMIVAGHETTAAEIAWAFQLLAHHTPIQDRLIEEINAGSEEPYLTATVQETLRHRPAFIFAIPREVVIPIEIGGWNYRPPVHLVGCTYLMHHNPALYPDPHKFQPERFLDSPPQAGTWLPWGAGRKRCVGRHFALLEMQAVLREVLSNRRIHPASRMSEHPRWRSAILVPHAGSRIILRRDSRKTPPQQPTTRTKQAAPAECSRAERALAATRRTVERHLPLSDDAEAKPAD
jgi:cytochrome P450